MSEYSDFGVDKGEEIKEIMDPFSPENAPKLSLIVQMRIYDALMGIYTATDAEGAARLYELHAKGGIMGALPFLDVTEDE